MADIEADPRTMAVRDKPKQRLAWMDLLRGAAALLVMLLHATTLTRDFGIAPWRPLLTFSQALGPVRMPLLMMLSGMLLSRSLEKPWPEYTIKKIAALLYPFLLWTAIIGTLIKPDLLASTFLWTGGSYLWFLLFLFSYYGIALFLTAIPSIVIVIAAALVSFISPDNSMYYERYFFLLSMFYVGKMLQERDAVMSYVVSRKGAVINGLCAAALLVVSLNVRMMKYHIEWIVLIVPGTLFLFWLAHVNRERPSLSWLSMMGRNSIVTYVLHWPLIWAVIKVLQDRGVNSPSAITIAACAITFAICLIATIGRERYGWFEWLYKMPRALERIAIAATNRFVRTRSPDPA